MVNGLLMNTERQLHSKSVLDALLIFYANIKYMHFYLQINQAVYIKMVSEFCRRSQSYLYGDEGMTMGALYWQLNDIWPGPSWSSIGMFIVS